MTEPTVSSGGGSLNRSPAAHHDQVGPPVWIAERGARVLGAVVAAAIATVPALVGLRDSAGPGDSVAVSLVGGAIVVPLGWHLGPDAVATGRRASRSAWLMGTIPMLLGAFIVGIGWMLRAVLEGNATPAEVIAGGLVLGAIGIVVEGWAVMTFITLPSALAWVAILRSIGWVASRNRAVTPGIDR